MKKVITLSENKQLVKREYPSGYITWNFYCPACKDMHSFSNGVPSGVVWEWNGNMEVPSFHPSLRYLSGTRCHLFLKEGVIEFLGDCPHDMRGQKVPLQEIPEEFLGSLTREE